jgi:hypothetical protein
MDILISANTAPWYIGLGLGIVVVIVAVIIVVTIILLAARIDGQAATAVGAVDKLREQTDELDGGTGRINGSGVRILHAARALRKAAVGH